MRLAVLDSSLGRNPGGEVEPDAIHFDLGQGRFAGATFRHEANKTDDVEIECLGVDQVLTSGGIQTARLEIELDDAVGVVVDGPTDAAGAYADGGTRGRAATRGLDAGDCLLENDSNTFFKGEGGVFVTGPSGTNAMDLVLGLCRPPPGWV